MAYYNNNQGYGNPYSQNGNQYGNSNAYNRPSNPYDRPANPYDTGRSEYSSSPAPPAYGQASNLEMQPLTSPEQPRQDPNHLLNECRTVSRAIDDLEGRLNELQRLQRAFTAGQGQSNREIDALGADIMTGYRGLTDRVRRIKGNREAGSPRNRPQIEALDRKLRTAINSYQKLESAFRKEVQESQRRQYLIVNPNATEMEIQEATAGGGDTQIFQQALLNSDRRGQAQSTLRNVQQRSEAIKEIERTMMELNQLFQDLDRMVIEQEAVVQDIEAKAELTHENLSHGNVEIGKAVVSARAARKKKWICLGICVTIVLVIILIIVIYLAVTGHFNSSPKPAGQ